jgi:hypothetical protein
MGLHWIGRCRAFNVIQIDNQRGQKFGGGAGELLGNSTQSSSLCAATDIVIFPNADGGFIDTANYRFRVLKPLAEKLGIEKLNFQILRRTMVAQAQRMGSVEDIQAHLRHARPDTTAHEYMQDLPEGVQQMVGSMYTMLVKGSGGENSLQQGKRLLQRMLPNRLRRRL